jgi:hypothetical protein
LAEYDFGEDSPPSANASETLLFRKQVEEDIYTLVLRAERTQDSFVVDVSFHAARFQPAIWNDT